MSLILAALTASVMVGGTVRDAVNGTPIPGVTVIVSGTRVGTVTDGDGRFLLDVDLPARLRFARVGYASRDLEVTDAASATALDVRLEPSARSLEGVTVTALRGDARAPLAQTTVDRAEIETRYFGQDVPSLLATEPSVTTTSDAGAYANYSYLRLRGLDMTRVNMTVDGVPLNDPEDQFVYFSNFPDFGNSLESVQLQRGVGTSSNGTSSYAGSIHFQSIALASGARGGELQLSRGAFDTDRASVEYQTGRLRSGLAVYGRASGQRTDGYRYHSGNESWSYFLSAGHFGSRGLAKLTAFGGRSANQLAYLAASADEIRRDPRTNALSEEERDDFGQHFASLSYTRFLSERSSAAGTAYLIAASGDYDVAFEGALYNFTLASRVVGALATWTTRQGSSSLDLGVHANDYSRDHGMRIRPDLSTDVYLNTGRKREVSGFARASQGLGAVTLFGDIQVRAAEFRYEPDRASAVQPRRVRWTFVNPKVGANVDLSTATRLYASAGENGREPTRSDMFAGFDNLDTSNVDFVGPLSRVRPERVRDVEVGVIRRSTAIEASANLFLMRFRNEITPVGRLSYQGLPRRKNVRASTRQGAELALRYRGIPRTVLSLNATLSRNRIREYTDDETGQTYRNVEPLLTPSVIANQQVEYALTRSFSVLIAARHVGRSRLANTGEASPSVPASWLADASATWRVARHAVTLRVNNVTDARAYSGGYAVGSEPYFYVQPPRNVFITARVAF